MSDYLTHIKTFNNKTFDRRISYISYNFSTYINNLSPTKSRVLEIGPGRGEMLSALNEHGIYSIDIVDNDNAVLEYCKNKYLVAKSILTKGENPSNKLKHKYDLIVLTQVFEHIPKASYLSWIRGLYKSLKPGGSILVTTPNGANPLSGTERYGDLQHENIFTVYSFHELMTFANLKNSRYTITGFKIPPVNLLNLVRIILQKILHTIFILMMIVNGAIYQTLMTPNITLIITKIK